MFHLTDAKHRIIEIGRRVINTTQISSESRANVSLGNLFPLYTCHLHTNYLNQDEINNLIEPEGNSKPNQVRLNKTKTVNGSQCNSTLIAKAERHGCIGRVATNKAINIDIWEIWSHACQL